MAAQEQTERATPAQQPAAPKQYFKGTVKQVLDGGAVVIRGVPKGGPPPERTLALTNINAPRLARRPNNQLPEGGTDEPFAWEAREFLRKLVVGKTVLGNVVHTANNRDYGVLHLGEDPSGMDVALRMVEEGFATVRDNCTNEGLKSAEEAAKAAGKGVHGEGASSHVRDITWDLGEGGGLRLVEQHKGKPIKAVVEHVRDGTTIRLFLLPEMIHVTLQMSGLRSPQTKLGAEGKPDPAQCEPFAVEAHFFTESRLLQRDVEVVLESHSYNAMNKITTLVGSVIHPAGNIAEALLKEGMAKCVDWSISKVTGGPQKYRDAEKVAKEKRVRIWRDYKPAENTLSDKEREFTGKVVEVVNGDALMVKAGGKVRKLHLASIRPPRPEDTDGSAKRGPDFRPLYDVPFMFEAREFLRKKLIGHQVQVTVDYVQAARTEPGQGSFPEKYCCTVMIGGVNVAEALVSKGLATVVRYAAGNDERSGKYDELLQAEEKAKKTGKGLHDKKNTPTHRVSDMTGKLEKCKQFLPFLKRAGRMQGLVEYVASGSRFRVYIPRETCIITFLLGGISCPRGGRTMPDGTKVEADKFGDEAATHVKEMILQREVEIEVESQDKAGNFIGYLFCENSNLSVHLVTEGYATMHFTADRSNYCNQIQNAQDNAKSAKKRVWKDYVESEAVEAVEEKEKKEMDSERKVTLTEVYVSEVTEEGKFYACNVADGPALETLMEGLRTEFSTSPPLAGAYTPKKGDLCAAKFVDDQWYRARIEKMSANEVAVLYIDYGNRASVPKTKLGSLPAAFTGTGGYAKLYSLALVSLPQDEELAAQGVQVLRDDILDKTVKLNVEYKVGTDSFVSVHIGEEDVGKNLVEDGLLLVERQRGRKLEKLVKGYEEAMGNAKKNHLNIWRYGDITQDDSREFGAPAPKPQR